MTCWTSRASRAGRIDLRREPVDVMQIVGQAVDVVRPLLDEGEEIEIEMLADAPLRVDADLTRLEQSIVNLLLNAIKYTLEGRQDQDYRGARGPAKRSISISDNGIGIAPDLLPRIFELFTQADRSLDRSQGGLGIGLFICRRLIELHGGTLTAISEGLGRGATFSIRLPLLQEAGTPRRRSPSHSRCSRTASPRLRPSAC